MPAFSRGSSLIEGRTRGQTRGMTRDPLLVASRTYDLDAQFPPIDARGKISLRA